MSHLESHASQKEGNSLILKELKKGFANFSDRLKADGLSKTFVSDEISKLEKLENDLEEKKEVLESRIHDKKTNFWMTNGWLLFMFTISIISSSAGDIFRPKDQHPLGIWPKSAFNVAAVIFFFLLGFEVFQGIMAKITDWKRRRNTTKKVSVEDGDATNERIFFIATDYDHLMNRYRKLIKDVNENYEPMRNRCKSLFNQYIFYVSFKLPFVFNEIFFRYVVGILTATMVMISSVIDSFFYNTEHDCWKTVFGCIQLLNSILSPLVCYGVIRHQIGEENEIQY